MTELKRGNKIYHSVFIDDESMNYLIELGCLKKDTAAKTAAIYTANRLPVEKERLVGDIFRACTE